MQKDCQKSYGFQPKGVNSYYLLSGLLSGTAVLTNQTVRTFARHFPRADLTLPVISELASLVVFTFFEAWGAHYEAGSILSLEAGTLLF